FDGARGPRALRSFPTRRSSDLPRPREVPDGGGSPAAWFADGRDTGRFELIVGPTVEASDDPDLFLRRYTTGDSENWGRYSNPAIDDLFSRQSRTLDHKERSKLVQQLQKVVLENAYYMPGLWWSRNVVHWTKVKNYVAPPNHYANQKLQDVWLAED